MQHLRIKAKGKATTDKIPGQNQMSFTGSTCCDSNKKTTAWNIQTAVSDSRLNSASGRKHGSGYASAALTVLTMAAATL